MHRCVICDYTNTHGSEYADKAYTPRNKVTWVSKLNGYFCTDCQNSINQTTKGYENPDPKAF